MRSPENMASKFALRSSASIQPQSPLRCRPRHCSMYSREQAASAPGVATVWPRSNNLIGTRNSSFFGVSFMVVFSFLLLLGGAALSGFLLHGGGGGFGA